MARGIRCVECGEIKEPEKIHACHGRADVASMKKPETQSEAAGFKPEAEGSFPLRPLEDLVFVKRTINETKTASGIVIATSAKKITAKTSGEIMAVGPGKFSETLGKVIQPRVEVGQKVVFSRHANMSIDIEGIIPKDGEEYLVMHADELIAVITGEGGASLAPEPAPKVRAVN